MDGPFAANALRPVLGRWQLLCLGIGAIIGSGIFVVPGPAAALFAGPAIIVSFVIAAVGCALAGLCYAELAAMLPASGGAYSYSAHAFGRLFGWLVGWLLVLEYLFAAAIVAQAFSGYALSLFSIESAAVALALKVAAPLLLLFAVTCLAVRGVELSAGVVATLVLVKVGVIILIVVFGARFVNAEHWTPFIRENTGSWGEYGWSGVIRGAGIVFYAYLGFDTVSVAAQEARRPQRDIPFALIGSLAVCTVLFIALMTVITGLIDTRELNVANPIAVAVEAVGPSPWCPYCWSYSSPNRAFCSRWLRMDCFLPHCRACTRAGGRRLPPPLPRPCLRAFWPRSFRSTCWRRWFRSAFCRLSSLLPSSCSYGVDSGRTQRGLFARHGFQSCRSARSSCAGTW
jgi:amino acid transporter